MAEVQSLTMGLIYLSRYLGSGSLEQFNCLTKLSITASLGGGVHWEQSGFICSKLSV